MATLNIGMKVNRAIAGATTVTANAYAMVTYVPTLTSTSLSNDINMIPLTPITRYFGPGQSIPSSFTQTTGRATGNPGSAIVSTQTYTYSLLSGVEIINTI